MVRDYFPLDNHISPASLIDMRGGYFDSLEPPHEPVIMGLLPNRVIQINNLSTEHSPQQEASTLKKYQQG